MANSMNDPKTPKGARIVFGIFMVLIYLVIGTLFILNIFNIDNQTISIIVGALLVVYGVWRGYRLYIGSN
ncbi:MAG: hypothetical protein K2G11_07210 [Muribaculaceae bacterium]|nr:hypothetical protein [Bacteroidales bacterium]MDE6084262.1 hypothetical protein [Muribaculaceae bacterium]